MNYEAEMSLRYFFLKSLYICVCRYFVFSNLVEPYSLTVFSLSAYILSQSFWKKYSLKFCVFKYYC